jgi:hypothetical protein
MEPRNAYKDMLDNVVSPITCVSMNHQNQIQQMANGAMFATLGDRRWWCWGFLGAAVDEVLGRPGFILTRRRTVRRSVTRLRTRVRSGELLATKIMWSQGDV